MRHNLSITPTNCSIEYDFCYCIKKNALLV